jgi:cytochrome c oxidase assembly factor CtaG
MNAAAWLDDDAGEKSMTWIILSILWVFLFWAWHAPAIFGEDDCGGK